jgi:hypothetical protein
MQNKRMRLYRENADLTLLFLFLPVMEKFGQPKFEPWELKTLVA